MPCCHLITGPRDMGFFTSGNVKDINQGWTWAAPSRPFSFTAWAPVEPSGDYFYILLMCQAC